MGWVSFLRALESASGMNELGTLLTERAPSLGSIFQAFEEVRVNRPSAHDDLPGAKGDAARMRVLIEDSSSAVEIGRAHV